MISGMTVFMFVMTIGFFGLLAYVVGKWAMSTDMEIVARRKAAAKLASKLKEMGLEKTPDFLVDYSSGDYVGMGDKIKALAELFNSGEEAVLREFSQVRNRTIDAMLKTPEGRALLAAKLQDVAEAADPAITKAVTATAATAAATLVPAIAPLAALAV